MENFEYSKAFPAEGGDADELDLGEAETIKDFIHTHERAEGQFPVSSSLRSRNF